MIAFTCTSQTVSAAGNYTWTGTGGNSLYTNVTNWSTTNGLAPVKSNDVVYFSGNGVATRSGQNEAVLFDYLNSPATLGGANGLNTIRLTSSQTTSVIIQSESEYINRSIRFSTVGGTSAYVAGTTTSNIQLDAGSGSMKFDGDMTTILRLTIGAGTSGAPTNHVFVNNNAPGGSVLDFGSGVIFMIGIGMRFL